MENIFIKNKIFYIAVHEFAKLLSSRAFELNVPSHVRAFPALLLSVPYVPSPPTRLRALPAFAPYVPYLCASSTRLVFLLYAPCALYLRAHLSYLCALNSFLDGFVVHQKVPIFQGLLRALLTVLFLNFLNREFF